MRGGSSACVCVCVFHLCLYAFLYKNILYEETSVNVFRWMVELTHEDSVIAATEKYTKQSFGKSKFSFPRISKWLYVYAHVS